MGRRNCLVLLARDLGTEFEWVNVRRSTDAVRGLPADVIVWIKKPKEDEHVVRECLMMTAPEERLEVTLTDLVTSWKENRMRPQTDYHNLISAVAAAQGELANRRLRADVLYLPSSWRELALSEADRHLPLRVLGMTVERDDEGEARVETAPEFGPQHALVTLPEPLSA
jgi:hypothetical protein